MRNPPDLRGVPSLPDALCIGQPLEFFFPDQPIISKEARALCELCPEQTACLQWALDHHPEQGIWAGTTYRERLKLIVEKTGGNFCRECQKKIPRNFHHCEGCRREMRRAKKETAR